VTASVSGQLAGELLIMLRPWLPAVANARQQMKQKQKPEAADAQETGGHINVTHLLSSFAVERNPGTAMWQLRTM
jgi:hypothetical protein